MATSGSLITSAYNLTSDYYGVVVASSLKFSWAQISQDASNNQTTISWQITGVRKDTSGNSVGGYYETGPVRLTVDGEEWYYFATHEGADSSYEDQGENTGGRIAHKDNVKIASGTHTFTHSADGSKSFQVKLEGVCYIHDNDLSDPNMVGTQTFSLEAINTRHTVTLSKGTGISAVSGAGAYAKGARVTLGATVQEGYQWSEWTGTYTSTTKAYSFDMPDSDVSMTANATIITYPISYNANGGGGAPSGQTKTYGTALTLTSATPSTAKQYTMTFDSNGGSAVSAITRKCTFNKWNTASDGSGTSYSPGGSYTANASATLYAQWTNPAAGTLPTPTYPNATFVGWFTAKSGGTQVTSSTTISSNITLYARWSYKVIYDGNYGSDASAFDDDGICLVSVPATQTKQYGVNLTLSSQKGDWPGKTFSGWNTKSDGTGTSYSPGNTYTGNVPLILYAQWGLASYSVTFSANGGKWADGSTANKTYTVKHGQSVTPPTAPTRDGKSFQGWNGDYSCVVSNRTISAIWAGSPVWIMTTGGWVRFLDE